MTDQLPTAPRKPGRPAGQPLSEAELAQRRAAAQKSTGPVTEEGKARSSRNAWKHGQYSAIHATHFDHGLRSVLGFMGKPCQTTCPMHPDNPERTSEPCTLVLDGLTSAGGSCLDKRVYVDAFGAIIEAVSEGGDRAGVHALMGAEIASTVQLLHEVRASIASEGMLLKVPAINDDGEVITRADGTEVFVKYFSNPLVPVAFKALEQLGTNLPELLATPRAQAQAKTDGKKADAMTSMLGALVQRGQQARIESGE